MFKVEKHYYPLYELVVSMPMFILDSDEAIEASVDGTYLTERLAAGNIILRWFAKKIDHHTPMYNDTVYYREVSPASKINLTQNRKNSVSLIKRNTNTIKEFSTLIILTFTMMEIGPIWKL